MWHEARRQEKQLRARIVDCSKRAEKRRRFYDSVRKDPDQFMQLHGRKCVIHTDKSIAKAAEDNNILRKWQGDPSVLIDRFDVRSHLDFIPPVKKKTIEPDSEDEKIEMICDFERYRVLIINEYRDVSEKDYLRKIAEKEFWKIPKDDQLKSEHDKKKKSAETKATIGFTYENSVIVKKEHEDTEASDDDTDIDQPEDIDVELDLRGADAESQRRVNCIGEAYGVRRGGFAGLLNADAVARAETAELRRIDREKAALAGRDSKHERLLLKKQRALIVGKGCPDEATVSLLSFVESAAAKKKAILETSSSSDSEEEARPQFITTFGNDDRRADKEAGCTLSSVPEKHKYGLEKTFGTHTATKKQQLTRREVKTSYVM
nr:Splicing factor domain containing protein [Haemonchus contortus]